MIEHIDLDVVQTITVKQVEWSQCQRGTERHTVVYLILLHVPWQIVVFFGLTISGFCMLNTTIILVLVRTFCLEMVHIQIDTCIVDIKRSYIGNRLLVQTIAAAILNRGTPVRL